jgi:hypothetical protein
MGQAFVVDSAVDLLDKVRHGVAVFAAPAGEVPAVAPVVFDEVGTPPLAAALEVGLGFRTESASDLEVALVASVGRVRHFLAASWEGNHPVAVAVVAAMDFAGREEDYLVVRG